MKNLLLTLTLLLGVMSYGQTDGRDLRDVFIVHHIDDGESVFQFVRDSQDIDCTSTARPLSEWGHNVALRGYTIYTSQRRGGRWLNIENASGLVIAEYRIVDAAFISRTETVIDLLGWYNRDFTRASNPCD